MNNLSTTTTEKNPSKPENETILLADVVVNDRARKDMGDIDAMIASIKEWGVIQPIVLANGGLNPCGLPNQPQLVVGGRRFAALTKMGVKELRHGIEYVWRDEQDPLRLKSIELEENIKRKDMTWDEIVLAKQRLLEIMEKIHGVQKQGAPTISERSKGQTPQGFGVRKLAAMLGENQATTSQDLQLAKMVQAMPKLKECETKSAAMRTGTMGLVVGVIQQQLKEKAAAPIKDNDVIKALPYTIYEGDFRDHISQIPDASTDLVFTDLPYGVDINQNQMQGITFEDSRKGILSLLPSIAAHSYRILRDGRYAVYWFGFNFYTELVEALRGVGFSINPIPAIWLKHRNYSPNPLRHFSLGYEQALVVCKGNAQLVKSRSNIFDFPNIAINQKLQVAQKPIELCEEFINCLTLPSATVVDMFAGTGSTGVAALKNQRNAILFEKDKTQCDLIRARLSKPF